MNVIRFSKACVVLCFLVSSGNHSVGQLPQARPAWWTNQGVLNHSAPDDFAVANQGQAKNLAMGAIKEMNNDLASLGGAGIELDALAASLLATTGQADDYSAINLGQLKALAQPFYNRFAQIGYQGSPLKPGQKYPWDPTPGPPTQANDFALANLGQVKNVFSFSIDYTTTVNTFENWMEQNGAGGGAVGSGNYVDPTSNNGDGVPYFWKFTYRLNPTADAATTDTDSDGFTDQQEYLAATDPNDADSKPPPPQPYALIDTGTTYLPTFIASNGMMLGMASPEKASKEALINTGGNAGSGI